jgi:hypothetical protein
MPCFKPIDVPKKGYIDLRVQVPCGRCLGCRLDKRRDWANRLLDEAKFHIYRWFLTLTYSDDHLPANGSLVLRHAQLWQKRMRKARPDDTLRFFTVGEYGKQTKRAHYHSIMFGADFPDKRRHSKSGDHELFVSEELNKLWGMGHCYIGTVTASSCEYVAGYVVDKINGQAAKQHYSRLDPLTGEIVEIQPEFAIMSRRPGIGAAWYEQFKDDVFPSDTKVSKGKPGPVPRYYTDKLKDESAAMYEAVKGKRMEQLRKRRADNTPERLAAREEVARARLNLRKKDKV